MKWDRSKQKEVLRALGYLGGLLLLARSRRLTKEELLKVVTNIEIIQINVSNVDVVEESWLSKLTKPFRRRTS